MRAFYLLPILLFFSVLNLNAQTDSASVCFLYTLKHIRDTAKREVIYTEIMVLLHGKNGSLFRSYNGYLADSVREKNLTESLNRGINGSITVKPTGKSYIKDMILKNTADNKMIIISRILDYYYWIEPTPNINWTIYPDLQNHYNLTCQKATCTFRGRKYTAWFTNEIPINDGPWKFSGLPGLIVKIYDSKNEISFEFSGMATLSKNLIAIPENSFLTNRKEFLNLRQAYLENPMQFLQNSMKGGTIKLDFKNNTAKPGTAKSNNPIELSEE
ncbi:GLPGLI family protein [Niabella insulamsoli]|uniref:GLPGLI family protein n=1 Tax=Niabella insulamsoli TaxID=3144874 RepID=UPI0031FCA60C